MATIKGAVEAQRQALEELRLESEELYQAALAPDPALFPFTQQGPSYTPPMHNYDAPEGTYNDKTKVYTQWRMLRFCYLLRQSVCVSSVSYYIGH